MEFIQIWLPPIILLITATLIAFPLSRYFVWIMDGQYQPWSILAWIENRINSGQQNWKQYAGSLLIFNTTLFIFGYIILSLQPWVPLNPDAKTILAPSTIFNTVVSFMTNTDLQHYSGEQHFSNFSQLFFGITNLFVSAAIGFCALTAIIRGLRGDKHLGNFFLDVWRVVVYLFVPIALIFAIIFIYEGSPMTYESSFQASLLEPGHMGTTETTGLAKSETIVVGPVAAFEAIKMLGTNGGGFYGMNSAHPFENPSAISNFFNTLAMMIFPFSLVFMYGRMLKQRRHSYIIFGVMLFFMAATIVWTISFDTLKPNPALTRHFEKVYKNDKIEIKSPAVAALPIDQHLGNLEGKEIRFGTSAGATFAAITTDVTCGAINAEADSLNPMAGLSPMIGMWMNCFFGGKGAGMINMLLYIIIGIFLAGMMVGRTPEYLGKKIGSREVKLAIIALLVHPFLILLPTGLFAITDWGLNAISNPGAHGLSQILYQFSSASANNGSAFNGLGVTYGFYNNPNPAPEAIAWDIATGLVIIFGRFIPIIAPMAMASYLGQKKSSPFGMGTLRVDTFTFAFLLIGTIIIVGALLFFPAAALGPIAEHFGPIPFGR